MCDDGHDWRHVHVCERVCSDRFFHLLVVERWAFGGGGVVFAYIDILFVCHRLYAYVLYVDDDDLDRTTKFVVFPSNC